MFPKAVGCQTSRGLATGATPSDRPFGPSFGSHRLTLFETGKPNSPNPLEAILSVPPPVVQVTLSPSAMCAKKFVLKECWDDAKWGLWPPVWVWGGGGTDQTVVFRFDPAYQNVSSAGVEILFCFFKQNQKWRGTRNVQFGNSAHIMWGNKCHLHYA